jgi:hypothetical protein
MKKSRIIFSMSDEEHEKLKKAYTEAENDPDRIEILADWDKLDTEGWG